MTEFIPLGSKGLFMVQIKTGNRLPECLNDWLTACACWKPADKHICPTSAPNIHLRGLPLPSTGHFLYRKHERKTTFSYSLSSQNETKYHTRWIRELFGHVTETAHRRHVLPGGHLKNKYNLFFFFLIKFPLSRYVITETHLNPAENIMTTKTVNAANAADDWQMTFEQKIE